MVNERRSSDLLGPLHGHCAISLLPRAFRDIKDALKPNDSDDLDSIHNYMKSMALKSPEKLFEKAKAIVDGGSELLNSEFANFEASENNNEAVAAKGKENPQERRPALGRKRARFSLKPSTSHPSVSLVPSLDIDQLKDPEEYFLAHEKLENAEKELQRQRGGSMTDLNEYNPSTNTRRRRPGILGKSVSYKHHHLSVLSESDDTLISSLETLQEGNLIPPNYDLQQETTHPNVELQEKELAGSIAMTKNRVNELLDDLLASNSEHLDGDGALSLLHERLQIKPIDLDKLCLPDFHDIERPDLVYLGKKLPKTRNALSDIQNLVRGLSGKTPVRYKQVAESPAHPLASPTPPKSPLSSMFLLKRRILQSNPSNDPFSALNIDTSPARSPSVELFDRQSDLDTRKELSISGRLKSPVQDEITNTAVTNMGLQKGVRGDSAHLFEKSVNDKPSKLGVGIGFRSGGSHGDLEDQDGSTIMDDRVMDNSISECNADTDVWTYGQFKKEEKMQAEDMVQEAVSSAQPDINVEGSTRPYTDVQPHVLSEIEENEAASSAQPDVNIEDSSMENLNNSWGQSGQSHAFEDHASDRPSITPGNFPEQQNEEPSRIPLNEQSKARRPRDRCRRKLHSHRQSLAGAGTSWNSGIRRSTRIKRTPLEYWKGERFLYGRVHQSMPTVIGLKYVSPAKGDGKPTFRVHSYVSDNYKELVELAALH